MVDSVVVTLLLALLMANFGCFTLTPLPPHNRRFQATVCAALSLWWHSYHLLNTPACSLPTW